MANSFGKVFKNLDKAITKGIVSALNKAVKSAKVQARRRLAEETGLKQADVENRILSLNADADHLNASVNIATKYQIGLRKFAPIIKNVNTPAGKRKGVSVSVGTEGRELIPGAFVLDTANGLVVVGRKDAFDNDNNYINPKAARYKLFQLKTSIFIDTANAIESEIQAYLSDYFDKIVDHEIDYFVKAKFDSGE